MRETVTPEEALRQKLAIGNRLSLLAVVAGKKEMISGIEAHDVGNQKSHILSDKFSEPPVLE